MGIVEPLLTEAKEEAVNAEFGVDEAEAAADKYGKPVSPLKESARA